MCSSLSGGSDVINKFTLLNLVGVCCHSLGATSPNGNCCRNGTWTVGACGSSHPANDSQLPDGLYMLPYHINMSRTAAECMGAPRMNFPTDIDMWNEGRMDRWNMARDPGYGMG